MKPTTVRIDENMIERLDSLAKNQDRPRSYLINQALKRYVEYEEWFVQEVKDGLKEVEQGEIATDSEVKAMFQKWCVDAS
ncbi:MAG: ribbon-helix-helix domain-containing protein [Desulfobacula sp.]|nr:ribbon-helix-helix domain-containing protein [Desulfobacula sp.]